jgi:hypothetical protein
VLHLAVILPVARYQYLGCGLLSFQVLLA